MLWQITRSVEEANDFDVFLVHPVEDQVVRESLRCPGSNALGSRRSELPRASRSWILEEKRDRVADGIEESLRNLWRFGADVEVRLGEILLGYARQMT
jgi:hypothetical protein